ncbi:MAG: response regulator transcription factor [Kiritimatiellia bacterium]
MTDPLRPSSPAPRPLSPVVYVVDDDASFRKSLARLLRAHGFESRAYDSAAGFLESGLANRAGCIVLDIRMPGLSGLDLQEKLAQAECTMPVIFLTGHGNIPMSVRAMKKGATDFLTKPVDEDVLLKAIRNALAENELRNKEAVEIGAIRARIRTLTERELEVMRHVISGELNKQIGDRLGVVEKTIKVHRARVMEKMGVPSVAELVRLCSLAGIAPAEK